MAKNPLGEVFGFRPSDQSESAQRYRRLRLCPYNNREPNCTKDKAENPLGVCSVMHFGRAVVTCPTRFRQDWLIAEDAAAFFFGIGKTWTSLTEVRLPDAQGKSAGNIDVVMVEYDDRGKIVDFGSLEVQAVYISGNVRAPFEAYMATHDENIELDWSTKKHSPRPDFLSSSRKRLAPQLLFKGGILHAWGKRMAVALDSPFFDTLPVMPEVPEEDAELAWLVYELVSDTPDSPFQLVRQRTVYTRFADSLNIITRPDIGRAEDFVAMLQSKLDYKLEGRVAPVTTSIVLDDQ